MYESGTFYANVILLEKRAEYLGYVVTSNNTKVIDSNNIEVTVTMKEEYLGDVVTSNNIKVVDNNNIKVTVTMKGEL